MSSPSLRTARSNRVLALLPREALERIMPSLQIRPLKVRQVLQAPGIDVDSVVFPLTGVASMISLAFSGRAVEVATIGSEGMVGMPLFLGGQSAASEVFIQIAGDGMFMSAARFRGLLANEPTLLQSLLLYTQGLLTQVAQCSACTSYHPIGARCARWLLQSQDRVGKDEFLLTHEFLALMLGVRRATVSVAAHLLQEQGLIQYRRGMVTVLDRDGLERASCECYGLINREFKRLFKIKRAD